MKIIGNKDNVDMLTYVHKGKQITFEYMKPPRYNDISTEYFSEKKRAHFIFDDTSEIDLMIDTLQQFKEEVLHIFNNWHKTDKYTIEDGDYNENDT